MYEGNPEAHPEIAIALRAYKRWKTFGLTDDLKDEITMQMIETVDDEVKLLQQVISDRERITR